MSSSNHYRDCGFDILRIISDIARPASTSPPTVFNTISKPLTSSFCSISINCGIICSYFVAFVCGGRTECPSI